MTRKIRYSVITAATLLLSGISLWSYATQAQRQVIYRGHLENAGVPAVGSHALIFQFYDDPSAGNLLDTQTVAVNFVNGGFAAEVTLVDAVLAADPLYVQITYADQSDGSGTQTQLLGRQKVHALPFAMNGKGDGGFVVRTLLRVIGQAQIDGVLVSGDDIAFTPMHPPGSPTQQSGVRTIAFQQDVGPSTRGGYIYDTDVPLSGLITYRGFGEENLAIYGAAATRLGPGPSVIAPEPRDDRISTREIKLYDNVTVAGKLHVGFETNRCSSAPECTCSTPDLVAIGGGGTCTTSIVQSSPGPARWSVRCSPGGTPADTWVICARLDQ